MSTCVPTFITCLGHAILLSVRSHYQAAVAYIVSSHMILFLMEDMNAMLTSLGCAKVVIPS